MDNNHILNYRSGVASIPRGRIVTHGADDETVVLANSAASLAIGVTTELAVQFVGERVDVVHAGFADVEAGAAYARGALLTADATGRAVTAATGNRVIGMALASANAAGERRRILVKPSLA